ncbi:hypothetical protein C8J57DRAFT_1233212 [Mycena rebaudengoi]|nr:hypothetical protein C8J57DRAFT_1233212 [Mycena rebaudengoi]
MLSALWNRFFPAKDSQAQPPLQRPLKYQDPGAWHAYLQQDEREARMAAQYYPQHYQHPILPLQMHAQQYPAVQFHSSPNIPIYYYPGVPGSTLTRAYQRYPSVSTVHGSPDLAQTQQPTHNYAPNQYPSTHFVSPPPMHVTQSNLPVAQSSALPLAEVAQSTVPQVSGTALSTDVLPTTNHIRGYIRRECIAGAEERKWKINKLVWRSNGTVQHAGHQAENPTGCAQRPGQVGITDRNGVSINVWEHNGDHASHKRLPGGACRNSKRNKWIYKSFGSLRPVLINYGLATLAPALFPWATFPSEGWCTCAAVCRRHNGYAVIDSDGVDTGY